MSGSFHRGRSETAIGFAGGLPMPVRRRPGGMGIPRAAGEGEWEMGIIEIILIGIALSADAMSVTVCNMLANPGLSRGRSLAMPVLFGAFQGLMPLLGCLAGSLVASFVDAYAGIIAFIILGFVGGKMIWDGFHEDEEGEEGGKTDLTWSVLVFQAIATSIDAFAVGVTFVSSDAPILLAAGIIALCTLLLCCLMLMVGRKAGSMLGQKAQVVGGLVLVAIGLKALIF